MINAVQYIHEQLTGKPNLPAFKAGDNITVNYKIIEGNKDKPLSETEEAARVGEALKRVQISL